MKTSRALAGAGVAGALVLGGIGLSGASNADAAPGQVTIRTLDTVDIASEVAGAAGVSKPVLMKKVYGQGMSVAEVAKEQGTDRATLIQNLNERADSFLLPKDRAKAHQVILQNVDKHAR